MPRGLNAFIFTAAATSGRGPRIAVKDNIDVRGMPTTAGGRHLPTTPVARDATCVARLRAAGCVFVGKTNLYEYAMGGTSHNEHYGDALHPSDPRRDAGGSSSGSAVAVAEGRCDAALGTDTMGSVRIPAAYCGVVGYKPPRGAVPRGGIFPNSTTLDSVGVLAPDVATASHIVDLMRREPVEHRTIARPSLAVPWSWTGDADPDVRRAFLRVARGLPDIALPEREAFGAAVYPIVQWEGGRLHRRWLRAAPQLYGREVRALIRGNARTRRTAYLSALKEMRRLRRATRAALATVDAIVMPTVGFVAPLRGHRPRLPASFATVPFNISDSAVFSIPLPTRGLPIGLQIVANDEPTAIAVARWAERRLGGGRGLA